MFENSGDLSSKADSNSFEFSDLFDLDAYEYGVQDKVQHRPSSIQGVQNGSSATRIDDPTSDLDTVRTAPTQNDPTNLRQEDWFPTENFFGSPFPSNIPDSAPKNGVVGVDDQPNVFDSGSAASPTPNYSNSHFLAPQTGIYGSLPVEDTLGDLYGPHLPSPLDDFAFDPFSTNKDPWSTVDVMQMDWQGQPQIPELSPFSSSTATVISKSAHGSEVSSTEIAFAQDIGQLASAKSCALISFHNSQNPTQKIIQHAPGLTDWISETPWVDIEDACPEAIDLAGQMAFSSPFPPIADLDNSKAAYIWNELDNMDVDFLASPFNNIPFPGSQAFSTLPSSVLESSTPSNVPRGHHLHEAAALSCIQSLSLSTEALINNPGAHNQDMFPGNSARTTHCNLEMRPLNELQASVKKLSQIPYRTRQESFYNQPPGHHLAILDFNRKPRKKTRERACFDDEKRMKVALTRKKGACLICRARKVPCETVPGYDYCLNCIKKSGDTVTAHHICVRQQLKETRFRVSDFYYREFRQKDLLFYTRYYDAQRSNISDSSISVAHAPRFGPLPVLHVDVHVYPGNDIPNRFHKAGRVGDSNGQLYTTQHYMIVETSLPDVQQLDVWGREMLKAKCRLDPHNLRSSIDEVLLRYCEVNQNVEIKTLLNSTMRIVSLSACRARPPVNYEESMKRIADVSGDWSDRERERGVDVSDEVYAQLVVIALAGIEEAEEFVLEILDKLRNEMKIGQLEWVAVGICLMRLLLVYRDQALRYANGRKLVGSNVDPRATRAMLMYDTLTAVYGATFHKTQSPLSTQVSTNDYRELLFNDSSLLQSMQSLQFHYTRFCNGVEFELEDATFQKLVAQPLAQAMKKKQKNKE
ncbi:hypothetical protein B0J14DRAFT_660735 [Halenospora varia]|nr:hypothetical protein B0J14DRAFT_660735 [Halenospora varia]